MEPPADFDSRSALRRAGGARAASVGSRRVLLAARRGHAGSITTAAGLCVARSIRALAVRGRDEEALRAAWLPCHVPRASRPLAGREAALISPTTRCKVRGTPNRFMDQGIEV
jgi:hypothetical protein